MPDSKTIDAILVPRGSIPGPTAVDRCQWVNKNYGPLLGAKRVSGREVPGGKLLFTPSPLDTLHHPSDSPLSGRDRYDWTEAEPGVMYGTLTDEARAESHA